MRVRCIGGPLDDTEVEVPDPPTAHLMAKWPAHPISSIISDEPGARDIPPTAAYQLEDWTDPFGQHQVRYVCPQRHDPRGTLAPGYEPPRPPPPSWDELMAERDRLVAEHGDPREETCLCGHGWPDHSGSSGNACAERCECQRFRTESEL